MVFSKKVNVFKSKFHNCRSFFAKLEKLALNNSNKTFGSLSKNHVVLERLNTKRITSSVYESHILDDTKLPYLSSFRIACF